MRIRNFLFHRVSDEKDTMWPPMRPAMFEKIIRRVVKNFSVVPLENYLDDPSSFKTDKKIATVLFDDGYKDNIEMAVPILKKNNCPASFYIVTDCIDKNVPTWTYITDHYLSYTRNKQIELADDFVPETFKMLSLRINNQTNPAVKDLKPWMKKLPNSQRLKVVQSIVSQCNDVQIPENKMMNWKDIRQLATEGFIIGSHSHTHPMLGSLQNEQEIEEELNISAGKIQQVIGKFPQTISYPIGSFDDRVIRLSEKAGYQYGLAVKQKCYQPGKDSLFAIPRVELYQEPWWKVQMRMHGHFSRLKKIWPGKN